MFGVVPKPLWERRIPADARNRIPLALRCLLVEHDDGLVLIDTGIGNKEDDKFRDIYGVENAGAGGRTQLEDALRELGHGPDDIRWAIPRGRSRPRFPRRGTSCSVGSWSSLATRTSGRREVT